MTDLVGCKHHGAQPPAYICQHLVQSIEDGEPRGLIYAMDEDGLLNAYCDECETMLADAGGEWTEELEDKAGIRTVCQMCTTRLFVINKKEGGPTPEDDARPDPNVGGSLLATPREGDKDTGDGNKD